MGRGDDGDASAAARSWWTQPADGTDGSSEDAGALVDGNTVERGVEGGLDPAACLAAADAGSFLEASGDLLYTGPTTTNVNDIVIGVRGLPG